MPRVKRGTKRRARRKKYLKRTKGFFPHQEQVVPVGSGSGQSRGSLREARPPCEEAAISPLVDPARGRRCSLERHHLRPVDSRTESRGHFRRPQGSGRHRRQRCGRICAACRKGQGRRSATEKSRQGITVAHAFRREDFPREGTTNCTFRQWESCPALYPVSDHVDR